MENLKDKKLALFINYFSSLEIWNKFGILERELSLYNILADNFKTIYIFSYGGKKELEYSKYLRKNIIVIPKKIPLPDILYELIMPFINIKILKQCDIYKTNQNSGTIAPTIAKLLYRKKLIIRSGYIGSELAKRSKLPFYAKIYFFIAEKFSYFFCDKAFIPTRTNFDILIKKYPFLKNKLVAMNNFINTELFKKEDAEKKYDIIYVARFDKDKNHLALLEAIKDLGLKTLFIGQGKEKEKILEFSKNNNLNLEIIERVSNCELPKYYNQSKIFAFPSLHEGNPKALLEAMSCEMPAVAFNVVGVNNIIENEKNGLISNPEISAIKENITRLLNNSDLRNNLGIEARKFILKNYSLETLSKNEIEIYKKILAN
jgi:glycosyltransferase involved in cell wall biosynthesis